MLEYIKFIKSVYVIKDLPKDSKPEVILCGRSNVGKSSLINSLFNKKNLAKTSSTPGKTRSINYYEVDGKFYLVDLPGFGYAKISKQERYRWASLIEEYLAESGNISLAFHLIDSRHKPTELDSKLHDLLEYYGLSYNIILTKIDKLNQSQLARAKKNIVEFFPGLDIGNSLLTYSSVKKIGAKPIMQKLGAIY
jgi:GTP-binding protein